MTILIFLYSSTPPDGYSGDPPNNLYCTSCHTGAQLNPGNGSVYISNLPPFFVPSDSYDLNIVVKGIGYKRFGFQMVIKDTNNNVLGLFSSLNANTTVSPNGYVKHLNAPFSNDSFIFQVRWKPPSNYFSRAFIYLVGNVANGNSLSSGDSIYSAFYILDAQSSKPESNELKILKIQNSLIIEAQKINFIKVEFYSINGEYQKIFEGYIIGNKVLKINKKGFVKIKGQNINKTLKFF